MKRFLVVFDGFKISAATLAYAIHAAKAAKADLSAVFLNDPLDRRQSSAIAAKSRRIPSQAKRMKDIDKKKRDIAVQQFQRACAKNAVGYIVNTEERYAAKELIRDSMFADLLIFGRQRFSAKEYSNLPGSYLKDLLGDVQCPVLVLPPEFIQPEKVVLLYDGKPSAVHAVKLFSYLFGSAGFGPVEVFTVKEEFLASLHVPGNKLIRSFIKAHFPKAGFVVVKGDAREEIPNYLETNNEHELVVLGAYRRSPVSRWFKTSMADILMRKTNNPLFIAHT